MPEERLVGYLYQELDAATAEETRHHIAGCRECQNELEEMGRTTQILRTWRDEEPAVKLVFNHRWRPSRTRRLAERLPGLVGSRFAWGVLSGIAAGLALMALLDYSSGPRMLPDPGGSASPASIAAADPVTQEDLLLLQKAMLAQIAEMLEAAEEQRRSERHGTAEQLRSEAARRQGTRLTQDQGLAPVVDAGGPVSAASPGGRSPEASAAAAARAPELPKSGPQVGVRPQTPSPPGGALPSGTPTLR
ncbi:MAG: zf-HC2 domain-containing protein [Candidatus Latescibacterota bacterium]